MGNTLSCLASSSSENENAMDISPVLEMIQDVSQVDDLISLIEERLKAIVNAMNKPQQGSTNTSAQETASSSKLPYFIKFGKDLLEKVLKNTHGRGGKVSTIKCLNLSAWKKILSTPFDLFNVRIFAVLCSFNGHLVVLQKRFMSRVDRVTRKVINDVTKELAKSHLIAAGLSAVVYVLDQIELVSMNKNQCVMLLMYMCALAKRIKQLDEHLPHEKEKLTEAIKFIVEGSLMCVGQMKSHYLSRFFSASVEAADLQSVESQILHIYPDLTLAAIISILERTPVLLPASQGEDFLAVGIEEARDKVIELLNMGINYMSTTAVVLYGVGGIGKTTLAAFVFKELDLSGYKFCRLDIEQNCSVHDLKMLQKQILLDLFGKNIDLRSCVEGNQQLTQAFRESKQPLFMFIDNALRGSDLAKILPHDLSCLPQDTRILITTRKLNETDLLLHPHIQRRGYSVDCLSEAKSLELLCEKALGSPDSKFPPNVDIDGLVKICGGMPLVLEIVGSKLKRYVNDVSGCNEMVKKLKKSLIEGEGEISERVVDVVYNTLDDDCKQAFLDIACFFYNWRRRIVAYTVGKVELQALEDAALVKSYSEEKEYTYNEYSTLSRFMSNLDNEEGILKVHDIVKARGRRLSQSQRVTDMQPLADAVQNTQKPQKIKWIELCSKIPVLEAEHLDRINSSLRVIYAPGLKINGTCTRSFENLRYVDVGKSDLPMDLNKLKRLSVLSCAGIKDNVCELPVSLQLLRPSRVSNLPALVENLGNLLSLEEVDIEALDWKIKRTLVSLPRSFCQLKSLRFLNLSSTYLNALPENFGSLPALQAMCLEYCSQLASLPANFGQLRSLRFLNMRRCRELVTLPDSFGNLSALQQLCLKECVKLMSLPPTFGQLSSLVYLDLGETNLTTIPGNFGNLFSLKELYLSGCSQLVTLPPSFGQLKSLAYLDISNSNIVTLPDSFGNLIALQRLYLKNCSQLVSLPPNFGHLTSLSFLGISHSKLVILPDCFGNLIALKELCIESCSQLVSLPVSIGELESLSSMKLIGCSSIITLPESFGNLSALNHLTVSGCGNLSTLPSKFGQLKSLAYLNISDCKQLRAHSCDLGCLTSLVALDASACSLLEVNAIDQLVEVKSLMLLNIGQSPMLMERWYQLRDQHPLIVLYFSRFEYPKDVYYEFVYDFCADLDEAISNSLLHSESTFSCVGLDGQLVVGSTSCFPTPRAKLALLVTMCDLSSPDNIMSLEIVKKKCAELASQDFHIIYMEMENVLERSEERMRQILFHLPPGTHAWTAASNKISHIFCYAVYRRLYERYWSSSFGAAHTFLASASVPVDDGEKGLVADLEKILPEDYSEALTDLHGGFETQFHSLDDLYYKIRYDEIRYDSL